MPHLLSPAMFLFQDTAGSSQDLHLIMIFTGVIAGCIALVLLGTAIGAIVVSSKLSKISKEAQAKAQPLISKGQELLGHTNQIVADLKPKIAAISSDLQPKLAVISSDVQHISGVARAKTDQVAATVSQLSETVQDTNVKTREQVTRVRGMVSEALDATHDVQRTVQSGIKAPIRQLAGIIAGLRVGLETLADRSPFIKQKTGPRPVAPVTPITREPRSMSGL